MEEDAGKLIHEKDSSLIDYNRAGMPLLEIVSEPEIGSPEEAHAYLVSLKGILEYLEVSDCDMEKGSLRCDANISLKVKGDKKLGVKTELKNMNSFKAVKDALAFEVRRQTGVLEEGKTITQETRLWDERISETVSMRTKEEAKDYRYFPEPDLTPFIISPAKIEEIRKTVPELPNVKLQRLIDSYGISEYDASIIVASKKTADFAEECIKLYPGSNKKTVVNWFIGALLAEANSRGTDIRGLGLPAEELINLIERVEKQEISNLSAKIVLTEMVGTKKKAGVIIKEKGLSQISNVDELTLIMDTVVKDNGQSVADYKSGKANALMFLVGQVMKKSGGKANPKIVQDILRRRLDNA
jgi:aspartyl-tRNA(Asn)/glutamyl-tRNA(Gln) amidotransferase subunit B